jgi:hypothetical protein
VWTTCPHCKGSGFEPLAPDDPDAGDSDDECTVCMGDGGVEAELPDEDDPSALDDVDVKDED